MFNDVDLDALNGLQRKGNRNKKGVRNLAAATTFYHKDAKLVKIFFARCLWQNN